MCVRGSCEHRRGRVGEPDRGHLRTFGDGNAASPPLSPSLPLLPTSLPPSHDSVLILVPSRLPTVLRIRPHHHTPPPPFNRSPYRSSLNSTMSTPTSTKTWVINEKPTDAVTDQTFKLVEKPLRQLGDNEVLLRVRWLSNDPAQRTWIDASAVKDRAYGPFPEVGDAMPSLIMAEVRFGFLLFSSASQPL